MIQATDQLLAGFLAGVRSPIPLTRRQTVADALDVFRPREIKTPGDVKNWEPKDWSAWASEHGYAAPDQSREGTLEFRHKVYAPLFSFEIPKITCDPRSGYATGRQVRNALYAAFEMAAGGLTVLLDDMRLSLVDSEPQVALTALRMAFLERTNDRAFWARARQVDKATVSLQLTSEASADAQSTTTAIRRALDKAVEIIKESPRVLLARAIQTYSVSVFSDMTDKEREDAIERFYAAIKGGIPVPSRFGEPILTGLREVVEVYELEVQEAKDAKRRAREAAQERVEETAAMAAAPPAAAPAQTPLQAFKTLVHARANEIVKLAGQFESVLGAKASELVSAVSSLPDLEAAACELESHKVAAEAMKQQLDLVTAQLKAMEAERNQLFTRCVEQETELTRIREEHRVALELVDSAASASDWREAMGACVSSVQRLVEPTEFLVLATNIGKLKGLLGQARSALQAGKIPEF